MIVVRRCYNSPKVWDAMAKDVPSSEVSTSLMQRLSRGARKASKIARQLELKTRPARQRLKRFGKEVFMAAERATRPQDARRLAREVRKQTGHRCKIVGETRFGRKTWTVFVCPGPANQQAPALAGEAGGFLGSGSKGKAQKQGLSELFGVPSDLFDQDR